MMNNRCVLLLRLLTVVVAASALPSAPGQVAPSPQDGAYLTRLSDSFQGLAAKVSPAVVRIMTSGFGPVEGSGSGALTSQKGTGSGVILERDGYIITNAHVLEGASKVRVVLTVPPDLGRVGDPARTIRNKTV